MMVLKEELPTVFSVPDPGADRRLVLIEIQSAQDQLLDVVRDHVVDRLSLGISHLEDAAPSLLVDAFDRADRSPFDVVSRLSGVDSVVGHVKQR